MADTPEYPDCNPALFAAPDGSVWLFWPTILDHRWEGAILKYATADPSPAPPGPVKWARSGVLHITPDSADFAAAIDRSLALLTEAEKTKYRDEIADFSKRSRDLLYQRLGWMPRVHPIALPSGRWILPLYCDTFSASLMAISDDRGASWSASRLMVGFGNIQPSLVCKNDGTLVAFMRDNGPHQRIRISRSADEGKTWTAAADSDLPNPGAGIEAVRLGTGNWALIYNDTTKGRHSLAISLSDDEGASWKWTRHLERYQPGGGSFHYPSIFPSSGGSIHVTYTHRPTGQGSTITYARFNEAWIRQGDGKP
jgi:predicted neuraminidase